jgi:hypothetical protein
MLNKKICQECRKKHGMFSVFGMDFGFEQNEVYCPHVVRGRNLFGDWVKTNKLPPESCPYKLEHAMAETLAGEDRA